MRALDTQVSGTHYKHLAIQPVEFIMANQMGFCEGSVIKYVTRWRSKNGIEDLRKAQHFLQFLVEAPVYRRVLATVRGMMRTQGHWWHDALNCDDYIKANGLQNPEAGVIRHVSWWNNSGSLSDLEGAVKWMEELIEQAQTESD